MAPHGVKRGAPTRRERRRAWRKIQTRNQRLQKWWL